MLLGTLSSPTAAVQAWRTNRVCFAAGTPLLTSEGAKAIQDFRVGDRVLSRDEHDVTGAVAAKVVEEVFERYGRVMYLVVHGVRIGTTAEHPYYLPEYGEWRAAGDLVVGDVLVGHDGQTVRSDFSGTRKRFVAHSLYRRFESLAPHCP